MYFLWFVTYFFILQNAVVNTQAPGAEPKYVLNFNSDVYTCPDDDSLSFIDTVGLKAKRIDDITSVLTGEFIYLKDLPDKTVVELVVYRETGMGRYEVVATHDICDLCDELSHRDDEGNFYASFFADIDIPGECPIPPGSYSVKDLKVDTESLPLVASNVGKYQAQIKLLYSESGACKGDDLVFLACLKIDLAIEQE